MRWIAAFPKIALRMLHREAASPEKQRCAVYAARGRERRRRALGAFRGWPLKCLYRLGVERILLQGAMWD
jgi:hypothetical protein